MADIQRYALRQRSTGLYGRVDTKPVPDVEGDARWPIFFDRTVVGPHEQFAVVRNGTGCFLETSDPEGTRPEERTLAFLPATTNVETRPKGTQGSFERGQAVAMPDGTNQFYRPRNDDTWAAHGTKTTPTKGEFSIEVEIYDLVKL